jgi:hypothetical protein
MPRPVNIVLPSSGSSFMFGSSISVTVTVDTSLTATPIPVWVKAYFGQSPLGFSKNPLQESLVQQNLMTVGPHTIATLSATTLGNAFIVVWYLKPNCCTIDFEIVPIVVTQMGPLGPAGGNPADGGQAAGGGPAANQNQ